MKKKIFTFLLACILVLGITGCGKKTKQEIRDWKDQYFNYLSYMEKHNPVKIHKVGFVKSKVSDIPIMFVEEERTDEKKNNKSLSFYWIKDNEVIFIHGSAGNKYSEVKYFYNADTKEYDYYEVWGGSYDNSFYSLLESLIQSWTEYKNKDDFAVTSYEVLADGFIKTDDNTKKHIDDVLIDTGASDLMFTFEDNQNKFRDSIDNLKSEDELVTEEVKAKVDDELKRIKQSPKTSDGKDDSSKKNDNSAKTSSDVITAGNFTIKYGTYKSSISEYMEEFGGEYTIKPDGTFTYINNWKDMDGNSYTNEASGTYKVEYRNMKEMEEMDDDFKWVITFTATSYSGKGRFTDPTSPNDAYYNVDTYDITGNNKFQASQYENVWTLVG